MLKRHVLALLNWFYPRRCAPCGGDLPFDDPSHLCPFCLSRIRRIHEPLCAVCGIHLPDGGRHCYHCRREKNHFALIRSSAAFEGPMKETIHHFKYRGNETLSLDLSDMLHETWKTFPELRDSEVILPVPLHAGQLRERGYNQSRLLADGLIHRILDSRDPAEKAPRPELLEGVLIRVRNTPSQTSLTREQRTQNVLSAFAVTAPERVRSKRVLLVDDVCTTGSTLNECARVLKQAGAEKVCGLTAARD